MAQENARVLGNTETNNWINKIEEFLEQLRKYKCLFVDRQEHKALTKIYLRKISLVWTHESRDNSLILTGTRNFSLFWGPHILLFAGYRGRD